MYYLILLILLLPTYLFAQPQANSFKLVKAFPSLTFTQPVDLQKPPQDKTALFVVEQNGKIYRFLNKPNASSKSLFLDIEDLVSTDGSEEGLLGLAFHPNFEENRYFYVYYSAASPRRSVIARYTALESDPTTADPASQFVIMEVPQPFSNHNGGQIAFGPDGFLYIALGDGGSANDPNNLGQDISELLGSILRINVDTTSDDFNYSIPETNPFVGQAGIREEIFAYGLRNPWRFSFDNKSSRIWSADVGQNNLEEINIIKNGGNYGWSVKEGTKCFKPEFNCGQSGLIKPVHQYSHKFGQSVTGGFVYRGLKLPGLYGAYIYADFASGRIWTLRVNKNGKKLWNVELVNSNLFISSFGIGHKNQLYVLSYGDGKIYKLKKS